MAIEDQPVADHRPLAHRLRQPAQARHRRRARLAARRGRGPADQAGLRLGPRRALLRARRGARALPPEPSSAAREYEDDWNERFDAYRRRTPELRRAASRFVARQAARGWDAEVPRFDASGDKPIATRKASEAAIQWAAAAVPQLVGGSADLAPSTLTPNRRRRQRRARRSTAGATSTSASASTDGRDRQRPDAPRPPRVRRDLPHVLRLHARRGPALRADEAARRSGSTRTTRSGSARTARRTSRSSSLPGCGRCRAERRPAGRRERDRARLAARARSDRRPTAFALSRQNLPIIDPDAIPDDAIERGAYVLRDADGGDPELILIGTGSEVSLCVARRRPARGRRGRRVVSMPCMDTFAAQDAGLPRGGAAAALPRPDRGRGRRHARLGPLDRRLGEFVGMDDVRRVRPGRRVYEHFGITAERVAEIGRAAVNALNGGS